MVLDEPAVRDDHLSTLTAYSIQRRKMHAYMTNNNLIKNRSLWIKWGSHKVKSVYRLKLCRNVAQKKQPCIPVVMDVKYIDPEKLFKI